jgi:predicted kinase
MKITSFYHLISNFFQLTLGFLFGYYSRTHQLNTLSSDSNTSDVQIDSLTKELKLLKLSQSSKTMNQKNEIMNSSSCSEVDNMYLSNYETLNDLLQSQTMIIFVGIPGCGKSTFAQKIVSSENNLNWKSVNQDVYKSRQKTYEAASYILSQGSNVIIDRCNFDQSQRSTWIQLAHDYECSIVAIIFPDYDNVELCSMRATARGNDGLHNGDEDWVSICNRMKSSLVYPSYEEGFHLILHCTDYLELDYLADCILQAA